MNAEWVHSKKSIKNYISRSRRVTPPTRGDIASRSRTRCVWSSHGASHNALISHGLELALPAPFPHTDPQRRGTAHEQHTQQWQRYDSASRFQHHDSMRLRKSTRRPDIPHPEHTHLPRAGTPMCTAHADSDFSFHESGHAPAPRPPPAPLPPMIAASNIQSVGVEGG
jgi:hypothetical protein